MFLARIIDAAADVVKLLRTARYGDDVAGWSVRVERGRVAQVMRRAGRSAPHDHHAPTVVSQLGFRQDHVERHHFSPEKTSAGMNNETRYGHGVAQILADSDGHLRFFHDSPAFEFCGDDILNLFSRESPH